MDSYEETALCALLNALRFFCNSIHLWLILGFASTEDTKGVPLSQLVWHRIFNAKSQLRMVLGCLDVVLRNNRGGLEDQGRHVPDFQLSNSTGGFMPSRTRQKCIYTAVNSGRLMHSFKKIILMFSPSFS